MSDGNPWKVLFFDFERLVIDLIVISVDWTSLN